MTGTPQSVSDQSDTPLTPIPPSVSLTPVSNLVLHQGPPSVPGPSTVPGLPSTQATYAQWALNRQASGLSATPRFLGAEAIGDSKEREQQKQLLIQQYAHAGSVPPSFRPSIGISSTLGGQLIPPPSNKKGKQTSASDIRPFTITWWKQKGYYLTYEEYIEGDLRGFRHFDPPEEQSRHYTLLLYDISANP